MTVYTRLVIFGFLGRWYSMAHFFAERVYMTYEFHAFCIGTERLWGKGFLFLGWVGRGLHILALAAYPGTRIRVLFSVVFEAYLVFCESS